MVLDKTLENGYPFFIQIQKGCVSNNGYLSSYVNLSKGIRQGYPLSALLFLLVVKIIAIIVRYF